MTTVSLVAEDGSLVDIMNRHGSALREAGDIAIHAVSGELKPRIRATLAAATSARAASAYRFEEYPSAERGLVAFGHSAWWRGPSSGGGHDVFSMYESGGTILPRDSESLAIPLPAARKYDRGGRRVTLETFESVTGLRTFTRGRTVYALDAGVSKAGKAYRPKGVRNRKRLRATKRLTAVAVFRLVPRVQVQPRFDFEPLRDLALERLSTRYLIELGRLGVVD